MDETRQDAFKENGGRMLKSVLFRFLKRLSKGTGDFDSYASKGTGIFETITLQIAPKMVKLYREMEEKMPDQFSRTELLIGEEAIKKLNTAKVAIFGIGGVGSFAVEGLARAGIQNFILVDNDIVDITNLNRQIHATHKTIGQYKVDVMKERILDINPNAKVTTYKEFYLPDSTTNILDETVDYIIDAVDTVTAKIELVKQAQALNVPIISAMGSGNKLDPTKFEVTDIYKTSICPLAKVMRKELRARGIESLKVVYSKEEPIKQEKAKVPGSISFVPSVVGMIIAGEVIKDLITED